MRLNLKHGFGTFFAILALGVLLHSTGLPLLIAPFGASTMLLFGRPSSPLAQPANVVGGYTVAGLSAFFAAALFPGVLWTTAVALGVALMLMTLLRVTHPPAGALPLIAFAHPVEVPTLVAAVGVGITALITLALIYHRLIPPRQTYPSAPDLEAFAEPEAVVQGDDP